MKVAIVSNYPPPGAKHASGVGGAIASYCCNLVSSLPTNEHHTYEVYANLSKHTLTDKNHQNGVEVYRCWRKGPRSLLSIIRQVLKCKPDLVHIQHDFFLYGGKITALLFPLMLLVLRLIGVPLVVTMHGVVSIESLDRDIVKRSGTKLPLFVVKAAFSVLTRLIVLLSDVVIVHEDRLRNTLKTEYRADSSHIIVIPHGIEERSDILDSTEAKQLLGLKDRKILLFFGYLAGYKGIELLIDAFGIICDRYPELVLNIVGGDTPGYFVGNQNQGKRYSDMLQEKARRISSRISFYGFVPEDMVSVHLCAADLVLFPYLLKVGGSGALSMCIAYERPFLVSDAMANAVDRSELVFERSPKDIARRIEEFICNATLRESAESYAKSLKNGTLWKQVGKSTQEAYERLRR